jgi:multimeric flavodoxin WrbA
MKKILLLNGSFRNGNTVETLEPIKETLLSKGDVEIREYFLKDLINTNCYGCALCITKGKEFCPTFEEEKDVIENLEWCDALIIASPVYNGRETFIIKAFFDKFAYFVHRPRFFDKKAMVVVTRGVMFRAAGKYISKVLGQWGFDVTVNCGEPELPVLKDNIVPKVMQKIKNKTDEFYTSLEKDKPVPGIGKKIWFEVWKLNAAMGKEYNKADYDYWKTNDWFNAQYYYNTKVGLFQKLFSSILRPVIKGQMEKTFKGY